MTSDQSSSACGKIILSGEYAVVFGHPGIAIPSPLKVTVNFQPDQSLTTTQLSTLNSQLLDGHSFSDGCSTQWEHYIQDILHLCDNPPGILTIENTIPLGKGMGASTAFVIAIAKCLLGDRARARAREIEDVLNPGNSGLDFAVIWDEKPIFFRKDKGHQYIDILMNDMLDGALLIDTGAPNEQTPELVAWIRDRREHNPSIEATLNTIGNCTERLRSGEDLLMVMRNHNQAQQTLGIVTDKAKNLIKKIEQEGGAAKVIGAGGRTGGSGMVLALGVDASVIDNRYPVIELTANC